MMSNNLAMSLSGCMIETLIKTERKGVQYPLCNNSHLDAESGVDEFLKSVERRAFIAARMATQDDEEAFDIVQDAMIKMVEKHKGIEATEWTPYFFRIVYNKINDWHRRQLVRNRWRIFANHNETEETVQFENVVAQETYREPEQMLFDEEQSQQLLKVLETLSIRQQQALMLRLWEGFSVAETAAIMQCSEGSVKTHFSRGMHKLKLELKESALKR